MDEVAVKTAERVAQRKVCGKQWTMQVVQVQTENTVDRHRENNMVALNKALANNIFGSQERHLSSVDQIDLFMILKKKTWTCIQTKTIFFSRFKSIPRYTN